MRYATLLIKSLFTSRMKRTQGNTHYFFELDGRTPSSSIKEIRQLGYKIHSCYPPDKENILRIYVSKNISPEHIQELHEKGIRKWPYSRH